MRLGLWKLAPGLLLCLLTSTASAQPGGELPTFGLELELRGTGLRAETWEERSYEDFRKIMEAVVRARGGDPAKIRRVAWTVDGPGGRPRTLVRAEYTDPRGGVWRVEPEYVDSRAPDGFELVTPPLEDPKEIERIVRAVRGVAGEGIKSSVHVHVDGRSLVGPGGDATALINLINLHETYEPRLRRLFDPNRGAGLYDFDPRTGAEGAYLNRFNRPLYRDHPDLLRELAELPEGERTVERIEALFRARTEAEARAHDISELDAKTWRKMWKYRSLNVANALNVNEVLPARSGTVEFRMNDLRLDDPEAHRRQVEFYRALVARARALAAEGKLVPAPNHRTVAPGENPVELLTSADPAKAAEEVREMLREVGVDPADYARLIDANVRIAPTSSEARFRETVRTLLPSEAASFGAGGTGDAGLKAALEALRGPGARGPLEVRVRVPSAEVETALIAARRLAEGANLSALLRRAGHDSARSPLDGRPTVTVSREASSVALRIEPADLPLETVEELARLLVDGIETAARTGRVPARGGGPSSASGTLDERATRYAREVEGRALPGETLEALRAIEANGGRDLLLPLLDWSTRPLPRPVLRDLRFRTEVYLREAIAAAEGAPSTGMDPAVERVRSALRTWANQTDLGRLLHRSLLPSEVERAVAEASPERVDRLASYRRADGTLDWKRAGRDRVLSEAGGVAHFALALFLKELAVVAKTGDRARVEEFFEGLATTDFYAQYGLFVLGARVGEVAYTRYLQRFVKPRFVNGILKTNLVLATGLALPEIVGGRFNGKAFAISLGSLGLSSAAVRAGVAGLKWVVDLREARTAGTLARVGRAATFARRAGGWLYTVAELAVILFIADEIESRVNAALELSAARAALADAGEAFVAALGAEGADAESVRGAAEDYHAAWGDYRNFLYAPLQQDEAVFAARIEKVARRAKLAADRRAAALKKVEDHPALRASIERRYGSLAAYAESLVAQDEAELAKDLETYASSYERARGEHLREIYEGNRRGRDLLAGVGDLDWLLAGARDGAAGDPAGSRSDVFARWSRARARSGLRDALEGASTNRLEAYDDEARVLAAAAEALRARGDADLATEVGAVRDLTLRTRDVDERLSQGDGIAVLGTANAEGATGALERAR